MKSSQLIVETITSVPFDENTYIVNWPDRSDCAVFDPGLEPGKIISFLDTRQLVPAAIICTHGHSDHIGGNAALKERWPEAPIVIGEGDAPKLTDPALNLSGPFGVPLTSPPADGLLCDGDSYSAAGIDFEILSAPGHSSGHIVLVCKQTAPITVFGGDVLFLGSIGRTDFPDGDFNQLALAIHTKLFPLPDDTVVWPGHGPPTTIGAEKATNPFVGRPAGYAEGRRPKTED